MAIRFSSHEAIVHVPLPGSEREPLPGSRAAGETDPKEEITVTIQVRSTADDADLEAAYLAMSEKPLDEREVLDHAEVAARFGASPADLDDIEAFAAHYNLTVVERNALKQTVMVRGKVADIDAAFKVRLFEYHHPVGAYRSRTGPVYVPAQLEGVITGVFGLDNRPRRRAGYRGPTWSTSPPTAANAAAGILIGDHSGVQLAQRYAFPATAGGKPLDGAGQTVAVIELGGGYIQADLDLYFAQIGVPSPSVVWVSADGTQNKPVPGQNSPDGEVMLDIEVLGAVVPAARQVIYFGSNRGPGLYNTVAFAIADDQRKPKIISISWGLSEQYENGATRKAWDALLKKAALMGITVCVASGDHGSNDAPPERSDYVPGALNVDSPACFEGALACGGTQILPTGEEAWNEHNGWAGGGGISRRQKRPAYQAAAGVPAAPGGGFVGRGVPDVSATATGYFVRVRGQWGASGGTSAVAPLWAGLVARLAQAKGRPIGLLQPVLYAHPHVLTDITTGDNDIQPGSHAHYPAKAGWDPATGLGTPNGAAILGVL